MKYFDFKNAAGLSLFQFPIDVLFKESHIPKSCTFNSNTFKLNGRESSGWGLAILNGA